MVKVSDVLQGGSYLKVADLEGAEVTLTIKSYIIQEYEEQDKKTGQTYTARKPVFSFEKTDKKWVCNKTNTNAIKAAYGDEMDDWIGKPITLFPAMVSFGSEMVEGIRVRVVKANAGTPKFVKEQAPLDD